MSIVVVAMLGFRKHQTRHDVRPTEIEIEPNLFWWVPFLFPRNKHCHCLAETCDRSPIGQLRDDERRKNMYF